MATCCGLYGALVKAVRYLFGLQIVFLRGVGKPGSALVIDIFYYRLYLGARRCNDITHLAVPALTYQPARLGFLQGQGECGMGAQ